MFFLDASDPSSDAPTVAKPPGDPFKGVEARSYGTVGLFSFWTPKNGYLVSSHARIRSLSTPSTMGLSFVRGPKAIQSNETPKPARLEPSRDQPTLYNKKASPNDLISSSQNGFMDDSLCISSLMCCVYQFGIPAVINLSISAITVFSPLFTLLPTFVGLEVENAALCELNSTATNQLKCAPDAAG